MNNKNLLSTFQILSSQTQKIIIKKNIIDNINSLPTFKILKNLLVSFKFTQKILVYVNTVTIIHYKIIGYHEFLT